MMMKSGGPAPPQDDAGDTAGADPQTPPGNVSWFGARLRVTSAHCSLADQLFRLSWLARTRAEKDDAKNDAKNA